MLTHYDNKSTLNTYKWYTDITKPYYLIWFVNYNEFKIVALNHEHRHCRERYFLFVHAQVCIVYFLNANLKVSSLRWGLVSQKLSFHKPIVLLPTFSAYADQLYYALVCFLSFNSCLTSIIISVSFIKRYMGVYANFYRS